MTRRRIAAGITGAVAAALVAAPALGYQGGVSGGTGVTGAGVSASTLPNTTAGPPAMDVTALVVAGAAAGGTLIVLAGLGLARRRRSD